MKRAMGDLSFKGFLVLFCIVSMPIDPSAARRIESKPTVSVSGIVFCNQCSQENELTTPLQGAQVKLQCENSLPSSAVSDKNGHFTFTIDTKYYAQHGAGKCKVLLGKSSSSQCDVSTTVGNGISGAALIKVPAHAGSSLNEEKYSVGPFVYKPSHASCKPTATHIHHIEDTSLHVPSGVASHTKDSPSSEMLSLFPNAVPPHPHPIKPLPLPKLQAPAKAPAPSTPGTKAPAPSTPGTKAPPPSTTPGSKAPPPSTTPGSKTPPPSTTPGKAPPPSTPDKAPAPTPGSKAPAPTPGSKAPAPKPGPGKPGKS